MEYMTQQTKTQKMFPFRSFMLILGNTRLKTTNWGVKTITATEYSFIYILFAHIISCSNTLSFEITGGLQKMDITISASEKKTRIG